MWESLEVLFLGPREWGPLARIRGLWKVEALFWAHYFWRFAPLDIWLQARTLGRPFGDFRYGETLWCSGAEILKEAGVGPEDHLVDLGCGRGKMVFLARILTGARATGVELLPGYLYVARRIARWLKLDKVRFLGQDFADVDLRKATVVYVAGSIFADETREDLKCLVDDLAPGSQWLSVSWPMEHPSLVLESSNEYLFSWGRETVFRYRVVSRDDESAPSSHPCAASADSDPSALDLPPETSPTGPDSTDP